jgi:hypothetical protein
MASASATLAAAPVERQLTSAAQGHVLTNINCWSPDGQWLVYDVRTGDAFNGRYIEQVHAQTGEVQRLYEATQGAFCGVVTYSPADSRVVFIHGPENPTADWTYHFTRRRGAVVDAVRPGSARPLDAMTYAPPFVPGALRGGSPDSSDRSSCPAVPSPPLAHCLRLRETVHNRPRRTSPNKP